MPKSENFNNTDNNQSKPKGTLSRLFDYISNLFSSSKKQKKVKFAEQDQSHHIGLSQTERIARTSAEDVSESITNKHEAARPHGSRAQAFHGINPTQGKGPRLQGKPNYKKPNLLQRALGNKQKYKDYKDNAIPKKTILKPAAQQPQTISSNFETVKHILYQAKNNQPPYLINNTAKHKDLQIIIDNMIQRISVDKQGKAFIIADLMKCGNEICGYRDELINSAPNPGDIHPNILVQNEINLLNTVLAKIEANLTNKVNYSYQPPKPPNKFGV